jgi:hypothetical protein
LPESASRARSRVFVAAEQLFAAAAAVQGHSLPFPVAASAGRGSAGFARRRATGAVGYRPEEHPVRRIVGFLDAVVAEPREKGAELGLVRRRHLHSHQHAPVVGAVVAVVEEADVPAAAHAVEETSSARPAARETRSGRGSRCPPTARAADEMAHVQLRELVVGKVVAPRSGVLQLAQQVLGLAAIRDLDADEDVRDAASR